jgi:hypothetical protein
MKDLFLLDPGVIFLNHGSFGACPREVFEAMQGWQREMERNPVAFLGRRSGELLANARAALADELGAKGEDLVFVPNATTGVNIVARSLALHPGDEILTTDHEYGACDHSADFCADRTLHAGTGPRRAHPDRRGSRPRPHPTATGCAGRRLLHRQLPQVAVRAQGQRLPACPR